MNPMPLGGDSDAAVAANPNTSARMLCELAEPLWSAHLLSKNEARLFDIAAALAGNPSTPLHILELLVFQDISFGCRILGRCFDVSEKIARNPSASSTLLAVIARRPQSRTAVMQNPQARHLAWMVCADGHDWAADRAGTALEYEPGIFSSTGALRRPRPWPWEIGPQRLGCALVLAGAAVAVWFAASGFCGNDHWLKFLYVIGGGWLTLGFWDANTRSAAGCGKPSPASRNVLMWTSLELLCWSATVVFCGNILVESAVLSSDWVVAIFAALSVVAAIKGRQRSQRALTNRLRHALTTLGTAALAIIAAQHSAAGVNYVLVPVAIWHFLEFL